MKSRSSFRTNILLLVGTLMFMGVLGEVGIRLIDWHRGHGFISNNFRDQVERPRPLIPYRIFGWELYREVNGIPYIVSVQRELFPLKKLENTFRIIAFGGSTTKQKVDGVHYPLRLQQLLQEHYPEKHIEVINVGNDAYATTHLITLLAFDVISWEPDFVIMSENANDLSAAYFPRSYTPDYSNKYGTEFYLPQYEERFSLGNILFYESSFYWFLKGKVALLFQPKNKESATRGSYGSTTPATIQNLFRRNVTTFVTIAKKYKIPVLLATQPINPTAGNVWDFVLQKKAYKNAAVFPPMEEHVQHHNRLNEIMKEVATQEGAYLVDNDAAFGGDPKFFIDTVHYTREGIEKLANQYYQFFLQIKALE